LSKKPSFEYRAESEAGVVSIRNSDGYWHVYLGDTVWLSHFGRPDYAIDSLTMRPQHFPEGIKLIGDSMTLGLPHRLSAWTKVKVQVK
jgi:hypothetical protein